MQLQQFAQKAFIRHGDQVLVLQKSADDPHNPLRWEVPGGRMAFGEDVDAHLVREVREETGIEVVPGRPFYVWQWVMADIEPGSDAQIQVVAVARLCSAASTAVSDAAQQETDFIERVQWIPVDDLLSASLIPSLRPAAEAFVAGA